MTTSPVGPPGAPARLVNIRWGFTSAWVPLALAIEQFEAHSRDLQHGLALEWCEGAGKMRRLDAVELRRALLPAGVTVASRHRDQSFDRQSG